MSSCYWDVPGWTPLHFAAHTGFEAVVGPLLERGAEVSAKDGYQRTPLNWAACEGHVVVARLLVDMGADLSAKDVDGTTPEDIATNREHLEFAAMLKAEAVRRPQCVAFAMAGGGVLPWGIRSGWGLGHGCAGLMRGCCTWCWSECESCGAQP